MAHLDDQDQEVENKANESNRSTILATLNCNQIDCESPHPKAGPMPAMIMNGELHTLAQNTSMVLSEALDIYNCIVRLRQFYIVQTAGFEATFYWYQVWFFLYFAIDWFTKCKFNFDLFVFYVAFVLTVFTFS